MWRLFDPRVERFLIADEGEVVIDEVTKHWAAIVKPILEIMAVVPLLALLLWLPEALYWIPLLGAPVLIVHALWRIIGVRMDRFVITNMRVFRVHGILTQNIATMPLARILDISVHRPIVGRIFGYGHFIFESAAQTQGLKEIRYVGDPNERDLTIQRVIARAGLRGPVRPNGSPAGTQPLNVAPPPPAVIRGALADDDDGTGETVPERLGPNDTQPIYRG